MTAFKMILGKKRNDGTTNVGIRITHNRNNTTQSTKWFLNADEVTPSGKVKNQHVLDSVDELIKEWRRKIESVDASAWDVKRVVHFLNSPEYDGTFRLDFFAYGRRINEGLRKDGRVGTAIINETSFRSLAAYLTKDELDVNDITAEMLNGWLSWLKNKNTDGFTYYSRLYTLFNMARKEYNDEDGVNNIPRNPFAKIDIKKNKATRKRALPIEKIREIVTLPNRTFEKSGVNFSRDLFVISFLLIGMNAADLYEAKRIENGRLIYERKKTRTRRADRAEISVKIEPEAMRYLEHYKDESGERVFNFYKRFCTCRNMENCVNRHMKEIGEELGIEDLTFYAARHSWATIAINDLGIDKYTVHTALNHVDQSMSITDVYIKKDYKQQDIANRKMIDYLSQI